MVTRWAGLTLLCLIIGVVELQTSSLVLPPNPRAPSQVEEVVIAVAAAYSRAGLKPKDRIGVLGANCKEWMIAMQVGACMCYVGTIGVW